MLLSKAIDNMKLKKSSWATCDVCRTAWIDDMPGICNVVCPKCSDGCVCLRRGVVNITGFTLATDDEPCGDSSSSSSGSSSEAPSASSGTSSSSSEARNFADSKK